MASIYTNFSRHQDLLDLTGYRLITQCNFCKSRIRTSGGRSAMTVNIHWNPSLSAMSKWFVSGESSSSLGMQVVERSCFTFRIKPYHSLRLKTIGSITLWTNAASSRLTKIDEWRRRTEPDFNVPPYLRKHGIFVKQRPSYQHHFFRSSRYQQPLCTQPFDPLLFSSHKWNSGWKTTTSSLKADFVFPSCRQINPRTGPKREEV